MFYLFSRKTWLQTRDGRRYPRARVNNVVATRVGNNNQAGTPLNQEKREMKTPIYIPLSYGNIEIYNSKSGSQVTD
jgi:hypothetical protein